MIAEYFIRHRFVSYTTSIAIWFRGEAYHLVQSDKLLVQVTVLKGTRSPLVIKNLEKFSLKFSSSPFVICVNLLHP